MTGLRRAAEDYLAMRRALGFKLTTQAAQLMSFVDYCESRGSDRITSELALQWATTTRSGSSHDGYLARRLMTVRIFARHYQTLDPDSEIPPEDALPHHRCRIAPHLYSTGEISALIDAAGRLTPTAAGGDLADADRTAHRHRHAQERSVPPRRRARRPRCRDAGCSGFEVRQVAAAVPAPFDRGGAAGAIGNTVTGGARTAARRVSSSAPAAPAWTSTTSPAPSPAWSIWPGSPPRRGGAGPRMHDLRHGFTVATLLDFYRDGGDVQARLPVLSTWLGHVDPKSTYWYLQASRSCSPWPPTGSSPPRSGSRS